jgi:glycosyltransferase involved in cell wall biosynthesis
LKDIRNISTQRNIGADNAHFEHLLFLDADVVLPDNFLKGALDEIIEGNIKVAGTRIYAAEKAISYRFSYWTYSHLYLPLLRVFKPAIHGCSIFSTKEIHYKIGGFNQGIIFEDYRYGVDAAKYYKSKLLKKAFVRTSARRFYNSSFRGTMELVIAGFYSIFKAGITGKYMREYNRNTGKHSSPQY